MAKWWLVLALGFLSSSSVKSEAQDAEKKRVPKVYIVGSIKSPAVYELKPNETVGQLIARAGGAWPEALPSRVRIIREDKILLVNVTGVASETKKDKSDGDADFLLLDDDLVVLDQAAATYLGDTITVATVNLRHVYVSGDVTREGYVLLPENGTLSVMQALALAGGVRDGRKNIEIRVAHNNAEGEREWRKLLTIEEIEKVTLQKGDFIGVSIKKRRVYVSGRVLKLGIVEIPDTGALSVAGALALAGGFLPGRNELNIIIGRRTTQGKIESFDVPGDVTDPKFNQPLQEGDVLIVTEKLIDRSRPPIAPPKAYLWLLESQ